MKNTFIFLLIFILLVVVGCTSTVKNSNSHTNTELIIEEKECEINSDCVVFGETGDCNCGCYKKESLPQGTGGECFCAAPNSCQCINGKCEGVF